MILLLISFCICIQPCRTWEPLQWWLIYICKLIFRHLQQQPLINSNNTCYYMQMTEMSVTAQLGPLPLNLMCYCIILSSQIDVIITHWMQIVIGSTKHLLSWTGVHTNPLFSHLWEKFQCVHSVWDKYWGWTVANFQLIVPGMHTWNIVLEAVGLIWKGSLSNDQCNTCSVYLYN